MQEDFDKSTFLSTVKKIPARDFGSYISRDINKIISQGGDTKNIDRVAKSCRTDDFIDQAIKERTIMPRLNTQCQGFEKHDHRSIPRSIYAKDLQVVQIAYDLKKLEKGFAKTTKGSEIGSQIKLEKQTKRDMTSMYKRSVGEAYANIERENKKADYIKQLLLQA